jgi:hypothetical protein
MRQTGELQAYVNFERTASMILQIHNGAYKTGHVYETEMLLRAVASTNGNATVICSKLSSLQL